MPTGYTEKVESGEVTDLREYILICARAFGALIMMRDDPMDTPIPEKFEVDTRYYDDQIAAVTARIADLSAMTPDQAMAASLAAKEDITRRHLESEAADRLRLDRHRDMEAKVKSWRPPTRDHIELKQFMLQQLEVSSKWLGSERPLPEFKIGEEWRQECLSDLSQRLKSLTKSRADEIARTAGRQKWVDDLRAALPPAEQVPA